MRNVGHLVVGCVATFILNGTQAGPISAWAQPDIPPEEFRIMTPAEAAEYRARMANLTGEAREIYRNQEYERLRERARAQGYELSEFPPWGRTKVLPPSALADASQPEATVSPAAVVASAQDANKETADETDSIVKRGFHTLKEKLGFGAKPNTNGAEKSAEKSGAGAADLAPHLKSEKQMKQGMADYRAAMRQRQESYLSQRGLELPAKTAADTTAPPPPVAASAAPGATTTQAPRDPRAEALMQQRQNDYRARMQARQNSYMSQRSSSATKQNGVAAQPAIATSTTKTANLTGPAATAAAAMAAATSIRPAELQPDSAPETGTASASAESSSAQSTAAAVASGKDQGGTAEVAVKAEQTAGSADKIQPKTPVSPAAAMRAATAAAILRPHFYGKEPDQEAVDSAPPDGAMAVEPNLLTPEQMEKALREQRERERARFEFYMQQRRLKGPPAGSPEDSTAAATSAQNDEAMQKRMNLMLQQMEAHHEQLLERMRQQAKTEESGPSDDKPAVTSKPGSSTAGTTPQTDKAQRLTDYRAKMKERFENYMSQRSTPPAPPVPPTPGGRFGANPAMAGGDTATPEAEERHQLMQERIDAAIDSLGQQHEQPPRMYYPPMPPGYATPGGYAPRYPNYGIPYQTPYRRYQ